MDTMNLGTQQRSLTRRISRDRTSNVPASNLHRVRALEAASSKLASPTDASPTSSATGVLYDGEHEIAGLPFCSISERADGGVSIGGLMSEYAVARHPLVARRYPLLSAAILAGTEQSDRGGRSGLSAQSLHILRELKAQIRVEGRDGIRILSIEDVGTLGSGELTQNRLMNPDQVIISIELAPPVEKPVRK